MDVLEYLKDRQNQLERIDHPFSQKSQAFRYLYGFGVGVLAVGNMKSLAELQDYYDYFLECIALPKELREKIIIDINNSFEFRLTECVKTLKTKEIQYCFLLDLYKLYDKAVWSQEYCRKVMENFLQIFHFTEPEVTFFEKLDQAAREKNVIQARKLYEEFRREGFTISYKMMQYFFKEFTMEDVYEGIVVPTGKTVYLDKPTKVTGDIVVEPGASLLLDGGELTMEGTIYVNGGRIQMKDAYVWIQECKTDFYLNIQKAAVVHIENTVIDCNDHCGFMVQNSGRLLIGESEFRHSAKKPMIDFSGISAHIANSSFTNGQNGFLVAWKDSQLRVERCEFYKGHSEYGGAVFGDSIDNISIEECSFCQCSAKYLGAAIYFKYEKLGQVVQNCIYRNCTPKESVVFNSYKDDFEPAVVTTTDRGETLGEMTDLFAKKKVGKEAP